MNEELETGAAASLSGLRKSQQSASVDGEPCRNCEAPVHDRYCTNCGQLAQNFHRPITGLVSEVLGDFLSLDGRIARTIPSLLVNPGRVTRDYLDGKRQRFVPPFRLFLLSSFLFFLVLFAMGDSSGLFSAASLRIDDDLRSGSIALEDTESPEAEVSPPVEVPTPETGTEEDAPAASTIETPADIQSLTQREYRSAVLDRLELDTDLTEEEKRELRRLIEGGGDVFENRYLVYRAIRDWAPRLAFMFAPFLVLCLILVFPFRKGVYVYDHVITALHFQTWLYFLSTVALFFMWLHQYWFGWVLFLAPPVYIYRLLRRVYGTRRLSGVLRTIVILGLLNMALLAWAVGVFALSVSETAEISRALAPE